MTERVPSDHPSVSSHRARLVRSGGTRRPCLRLPEDAALGAGDTVRLILDGDEYHARVATDAGTDPVVRGAYDNRRLAREGGGTNRLVAWAEDNDCATGDAVALDEIEPGDLYGLRVPGERVVYEATKGPDDSLADIASKLDDG